VDKKAKYGGGGQEVSLTGSGFAKKNIFSIESGSRKPRRFNGIHEAPDLE
jgi:hypothetical protein